MHSDITLLRASDMHGYNTRTNDLFFLDTPHTTKYGLSNILYKATLLFNSLSSEIRNIPFSKFKKTIKNLFLGRL